MTCLLNRIESSYGGAGEARKYPRALPQDDGLAIEEDTLARGPRARRLPNPPSIGRADFLS